MKQKLIPRFFKFVDTVDQRWPNSGHFIRPVNKYYDAFLISKERYPHLRNCALKLSSIFGSIYICETAFSAMKLVKSKSRNRLTDSMLSHILKIATSELEVNFTYSIL